MSPTPQPASVAAPGTGSERGRRRALVLLLWAAALVGGGMLVLLALGELLAFFGESPTVQEHQRATFWLLAAAAAVVGFAGTGLALAVRWRLRGLAVLCALTSATSVLLVMLALATWEPTPDAEVDARDVRTPVGCVEHSGGTSDCPGG